MTADPTTDAMQAAFDRARNMATHGTDQKKSGRLDQEFIERRHVINGLVLDAEAVSRSWALWCTSGGAKASDFGIEEGLFTFIRYTMLRDAVLGVLRLTEPDLGPSELPSLCRIAAWLQDPALVQQLGSEQWSKDLGYRPEVAEAEAQRIRARISSFLVHVQPRWSFSARNPASDDQTLLELRRFLTELPPRNFYPLMPGHPRRNEVIGQVQKAVDLVLELAMDAAAIFVGFHPTGEDYLHAVRANAIEHWDAQRKIASSYIRIT